MNHIFQFFITNTSAKNKVNSAQPQDKANEHSKTRSIRDTLHRWGNYLKDFIKKRN